MSGRDSALFAARLHVEKGTLLSDGAVREVCEALVQLHEELEAINQAIEDIDPGGSVTRALLRRAGEEILKLATEDAER